MRAPSQRDRAVHRLAYRSATRDGRTRGQHVFAVARRGRRRFLRRRATLTKRPAPRLAVALRRCALGFDPLALRAVVEELEPKQDRDRQHDGDDQIARFVGPWAAAVSASSFSSPLRLGPDLRFERGGGALAAWPVRRPLQDRRGALSARFRTSSSKRCPGRLWGVLTRHQHIIDPGQPMLGQKLPRGFSEPPSRPVALNRAADLLGWP